MPVALAVVAIVATVAATTTSVISSNKARAEQRHANDLQQQAANEQRAQNTQNAAADARAQYREDRIRRARILQQSNNTGTEASSGEIGSLGSLQTQYSNNQGSLWGGYERGVTIGNLQSQAGQSIFDAQQTLSRGANLSTIFNGIASVASSGAGAYGRAKIPGTTPQAA
jgi:hypothetical protein